VAELIHVFADETLIDGVRYRVQVCGRPSGNIWEGWIEFVSAAGDLLRTRRETTQPNREALEYWAGGLSPTYFEGALQRTREPQRLASGRSAAGPYFDGPAEALAIVEPVGPAVLNPFSVGAKGAELLRSELFALSTWHLRNIVRAYDLADRDTNLAGLAQGELVTLIVDAVDAA